MYSLGAKTRRALAFGWTFFIVFSVSLTAEAANYPCSGSKGGVAGCRGETFICNDGSVSASKKSCSASTAGAAGLLNNTADQMTPVVSGECSCRSGNYCTGPRGGRFCYSDSGAKSYLRK
jgi:hypothetical protein